MEVSNIRITKSLHTSAQWSLFKDALVFILKLKLNLKLNWLY